MYDVVLNKREFSIIQKLVFNEIGISLNDKKIEMAKNRLLKRLKHHELNNFADYIKIVQLSKQEKKEFLNCISTNETYFFREIEHYNFLEGIIKSCNKKIRIWSAASSIGAEAYSAAMILDTHLKNWEVIGTDINTHVLNIAKQGLYQMTFLKNIPKKYKTKYCLLGKGQYEGKILIDRNLFEKMDFFENNLLKENCLIGKFDVIFLRNVLLYFTEDTKLRVIKNLLANLNPKGYLILGMTDYIDCRKIEELEYMNNSIYRKV